jgi:hypothetical protein
MLFDLPHQGLRSISADGYRAIAHLSVYGSFLVLDCAGGDVVDIGSCLYLPLMSKMDTILLQLSSFLSWPST